MEIPDLTQAIERYPDDADNYLNRGDAYFDLAESAREIGHQQEANNYIRQAIMDYNQAISLRPQSGESYMYRGVAYTFLSLDTRAQVDFERAVELGVDQSQIQEEIDSVKGQQATVPGDYHSARTRAKEIDSVKGQQTTVPSGYHSARTRANWTCFVLVVLGVLVVASFASTILELQLIQEIKDGGFVSEQQIDSNDDRQRAIAILSLLAYGAVVIATFIWIFRSSKNLDVFGLQDRRFSPGWAVGWWFVPFMNLVRPYQVMKEIWEGSHPQNSSAQLEQGNSVHNSGLLSGWWAGLILSGVLGNVVLRLALNTESLDQLILVDLLTLVVGFWFFVLVTQITAMQDEKRLRFSHIDS